MRSLVYARPLRNLTLLSPVLVSRRRGGTRPRLTLSVKQLAKRWLKPTDSSKLGQKPGKPVRTQNTVKPGQPRLLAACDFNMRLHSARGEIISHAASGAASGAVALKAALAVQLIKVASSVSSHKFRWALMMLVFSFSSVGKHRGLCRYTPLPDPRTLLLELTLCLCARHCCSS